MNDTIGSPHALYTVENLLGRFLMSQCRTQGGHDRTCNNATTISANAHVVSTDYSLLVFRQKRQQCETRTIRRRPTVQQTLERSAPEPRLQS